MLGRLGIGPDEEAVYRVMLKDGPGAVAGLVEALGWPEERARSALDRLAALSLVRPSVDGGPGRPVDPEVGLASLLAGQETELLEKERQIRASRIAMAGLLADIRATGQGVSEVQKLRSMDQIQSKIEHLAGTCTSEIAAFVPGGGQSEEHLEAARPLDTSTSDRGVRLRYIFLDSCRNSPATREYVAWLGKRGGLVRTVPRLPLRMLIYDRSRAIVPMDATAADQGALVLDGTGALTGLLALFEQTWQQAKPLGESAAEAAAGQGGPLSPPERAVLDLLTEGFTDEAIARQLGVSVRTVRRVTADLMHRLGARSRFEAGVLATTKGWVTV
ncbi:LuxR C-terminal-related transcriptional regulator [Streptomyces bacillaris]|uniref:LuxR C-terminal-related transcriptional regulator n=1 Tax=Streptomyces bacillaris TaxID=68179 RepID=UPI00346016DE